MTRHEILAELARMSAAERILLAQDLWESIADEPGAWSLSPEQEHELDRRLEAWRSRKAGHAIAGASWDEVKRRIRQKR